MSETKKQLVLLVDDDPLIIRMYQGKLVDEGYEVKTAFDGKAALELAKQNKPDFILMDMMMPQMNGVDALKALKADAETKDIPVFILTNLGDRQEDIERVKQIGAKDYFVKVEVSPKELVKRIKQELH